MNLLVDYRCFHAFQIISAILATMLHKLTEPEILDIAADCHGYVGADLQSLCRQVLISLASIILINFIMSIFFLNSKQFSYLVDSCLDAFFHLGSVDHIF